MTRRVGREVNFGNRARGAKVGRFEEATKIGVREDVENVSNRYEVEARTLDIWREMPKKGLKRPGAGAGPWGEGRRKCPLKGAFVCHRHMRNFFHSLTQDDVACSHHATLYLSVSNNLLSIF
jgi:hypothetical protein